MSKLLSAFGDLRFVNCRLKDHRIILCIFHISAVQAMLQLQLWNPAAFHVGFINGISVWCSTVERQADEKCCKIEKPKCSPSYSLADFRSDLLLFRFSNSQLFFGLWEQPRTHSSAVFPSTRSFVGKANSRHGGGSPLLAHRWKRHFYDSLMSNLSACVGLTGEEHRTELQCAGIPAAETLVTLNSRVNRRFHQEADKALQNRMIEK